MRAEIKARKHHDKALADGLAAAEARAASELAAQAQKCEAAMAALEKKSEGLSQGQQQLATKQTELAGSCQALDKVCLYVCKCCTPARHVWLHVCCSGLSMPPSHYHPAIGLLHSIYNCTHVWSMYVVIQLCCRIPKRLQASWTARRCQA